MCLQYWNSGFSHDHNTVNNIFVIVWPLVDGLPGVAGGLGSATITEQRWWDGQGSPPRQWKKKKWHPLTINTAKWLLIDLQIVWHCVCVCVCVCVHNHWAPGRVAFRLKATPVIWGENVTPTLGHLHLLYHGQNGLKVREIRLAISTAHTHTQVFLKPLARVSLFSTA